MSQSDVSALVAKAEDLEDILRFNQREKLKLSRLTIQQADVIKSHEAQLEAYSLSNERLQYERDHFASEWYSVCRDLLGVPEGDINSESRSELDISRASWNIRRRLSISKLLSLRLMMKTLGNSLRSRFQVFRTETVSKGLCANLIKSCFTAWRAVPSRELAKTIRTMADSFHKRSKRLAVLRAWRVPTYPPFVDSLRLLNFTRLKMRVFNLWRHHVSLINETRRRETEEEIRLVAKSFGGLRKAAQVSKNRQRAVSKFSRVFSAIKSNLIFGAILNLQKNCPGKIDDSRLDLFRPFSAWRRRALNETTRRQVLEQRGSTEDRIFSGRVFSAWGEIRERSKFAEKFEKFWDRKNKPTRSVFCAWRDFLIIRKEICSRLNILRHEFSQWKETAARQRDVGGRRVTRLLTFWKRLASARRSRRLIAAKLKYFSDKVCKPLTAAPLLAAWRKFARHAVSLENFVLSRYRNQLVFRCLHFWNFQIFREKFYRSAGLTFSRKIGDRLKFKILKIWEFEVLRNGEGDTVKFSRALVERNIFLSSMRSVFLPWWFFCQEKRQFSDLVEKIKLRKMQMLFRAFSKTLIYRKLQTTAAKFLTLAVYKKLAVSLAPILSSPRFQKIFILRPIIRIPRRIFSAWRAMAAATRTLTTQENVLKISEHFFERPRKIFFWFSVWRKIARDWRMRKLIATKFSTRLSLIFSSWRNSAALWLAENRQVTQLSNFLDIAQRQDDRDFLRKLIPCWRSFACGKFTAVRKFLLIQTNLRQRVYYEKWKRGWQFERESKLAARISGILGARNRRLLVSNCFRAWFRIIRLISLFAENCAHFEARCARFAAAEFLKNLKKRATAALSVPQVEQKILGGKFITYWREVVHSKKQRGLLKRFARLVGAHSTEGLARFCFTGWRHEVSHRRCRLRATCAFATAIKQILVQRRVFEKFRETAVTGRLDAKWMAVSDYVIEQAAKQAFRFWRISTKSETHRRRLVSLAIENIVSQNLQKLAIKGFQCIRQRRAAAARLAAILKIPVNRIWLLLSKKLFVFSQDKIVAGILEKTQTKLLGEIARRIFVTWKFEAVQRKWERHSTAMREAAGEITSLREEIRKAALRANILF